jgi:hypothetical protein
MKNAPIAERYFTAKRDRRCLFAKKRAVAIKSLMKTQKNNKENG